jgi:hypothetical protein
VGTGFRNDNAQKSGRLTQRRTPLFIVTSSRPRVGKTLIARALTEFFCAQQRPVAAFDVNPDEFTLLQYLPAVATAASIRETRDEMALFDRLIMTDGVPKVIDLAHGSFERFFAVMRQINFIAEARRRALVPMVLFVADPDDRSRLGYATLCNDFPELALVPVFNEAVSRFAHLRDLFPPAPRGGEPVSIPALTPILRSVISRPGFSFVAYASKTTDTTSELYSWLRGVFVTFRELEVRLLLGELMPRLRYSA